MTGLLPLLLAVLIVLAAAYVPGYLAVRALAGSRLLALAFAPAISTAVAGIGAMITPVLGTDWTLLPFAALSAVLVLAAWLLARRGLRLPPTVLDGPLLARRPLAATLGWAGVLVAALAVAVVPIAMRAGRADAVLERYDTLYHLTALTRIRETGNGSSLSLNAVTSTSGTPSSYPAAFHDLAALIPAVDIPIVLNGSVLALAVVPWVLGAALLARTLFPRVTWAPPAVAVVATVIPASPLNLWIHLSPVPNLTGFAMLSGALAGAVALWHALTARIRAEAGLPGSASVAVLDGEAPAPSGILSGAGSAPASAPTAHSAAEALRTADAARPAATARSEEGADPGHLAAFAALGAVGLSGVGLTLMQPNVAVMALVLLAALTAVTALPLRRVRPRLLAVPVVALLPVALLTYTPLGARVTGFSGGLQVPWWSALGEVGLGLLTVWPMALGTVIAVLWWPGLVSTLRGPLRWLPAAWIVVALMYLDAAVDSPLNLSVLFFRGQDRIAIPLAMLSALLVVPGLQAWARLLRRSLPLGGSGAGRAVVAVLIALATVATLSSFPARLDNAAKNLDAEYPGRGRFLQADELAEFSRVAPELDPELTILASPYSGAAHMYALEGIPAYLPVAGVALEDADRTAIAAVPLAGSWPVACRALLDQGIGYVYEERRPYQFDPTFTRINQGGDDLGTVLFETDHSRLIRIECDPGD